ncbi:hypothetical protein GM182_01535 [bacterium 3DAC]|nr:hypothetical protein GM182_01535 [bacterium 3DAC]
MKEELTIPKSQRNLLLWLYVLLVVIPPVAFYRGIYRAFDIVKSATFIWLFTIIGTIIAVLVALYPGETKKLKNPIAYTVLAFDVAIVLSTIFSLNPNVSFWGVYERQLGLIVFLPITWMAFLTMIVVYNRKSLEFLYDVLIYFGTFNALYGILQMLGADPFWGSGAFGHRAFGFQGNPDFFGPMLVLTAFLTLARSYSYLVNNNKNGAIIYFSMFVAQLIAVIGSMTRGAWVGFFVGIIAWIIVTGMVITGKNKKIFIRVVSIALIVGIVLFIATGLLLGNKFPVFSRLKTIFVWHDSHGRPIPRLILWRDTMTLIKDNMKHGRLTGVGIEVFRRNFMPYKSLELSQSEPKVNYDDPHNNYLSVWAKTGIIGILAYLSMFLAALWMAYRYLRTEPSEQYRIIMAGLVASLLGYAANLLTIFDTLSTALFFYIFLGIIAATYYLEDVPEAEREKESINLPIAKGIALIMVIAFVFVGVLGSYNYVNLWKADGYFRTGISYLNASQSGGKINPQFLQTAIEYLSKAYNTYPGESYYSLNLAKAYGSAAYVLKMQGKTVDAEKTYDVAKEIALSHEKDTWSPENLYMILGFNAYYMDKLNESVKYMEDIFKWDHWFFGAHVSTSQIFHIKWQREHQLSDLESSWKHANIARIVLRFYPTYGLNGFQLTYQEGYSLLTEYLKTATSTNQFNNVLKSSLDALLVYSGYKNPGQYPELYKNLVGTLSASGKLTSTDDIQPRIDVITALAQYQQARDIIENIKKQVIEEKTRSIEDAKQKQAIIEDINTNLLKYLSNEQKEQVVNAVKQIKTALQSLKNIHVPENFKLTDDSSLSTRLKTFIGYIESYLNKLGSFTQSIQAENITPNQVSTSTNITTSTQATTGTK